MLLSKANIDKFDLWLKNIYQFGGTLLIDKPKDWTSFDVVNKLKHALKIQKVGHTGSLDPFATGLLILLFNKETKKQQEFTNLDKTYIAQIKLGATTRTYDITSPEENILGFDSISFEMITSILKSFEGPYEQIPPIFSAKKISGKRAYILARKNIVFEPKPVTVEIYSISILDIEIPFVSFEVRCSKGTYIRSLANDIGKKLGVGAYLYQLRRTQIGDYSVINALTIDEFLNKLNRFSEWKSIVDWKR